MNKKHKKHYDAVEAAINEAVDDAQIPFEEKEPVTLELPITLIDVVRAIHGRQDPSVFLERMLENSIWSLVEELRGNPEHEIYMSGYHHTAK